MTESTAKPVKRNKLRSPLRDGYKVHCAALARGLNVRLLPRQVMEVSVPGSPDEKSGFTHGVPQASTLAAVTYAQDLRVRRAMLQKAGFAVPRGATFSVGRSQRRGRNFAARIGYPVVVKPAVGDNTIEVQTGLQDSRQVRDAIRYLYTPPSQRKEFTRAAYALTELREPGRINGKLVAPPGYRFLIEQHVHGQYLRFLVLNGEVISIIHCPNGPWRTFGKQMSDVMDSTHESLKRIAVEAAGVIPGLAVAAIDMVVEDHEAETSCDNAVIVELSERPWLSVQYRLDPELASALGDQILLSGLPAAAERDQEERITADLLIGGAVDPVSLLEVLADKFAELGLEGELHESDHTLGQIRGTVSGTPADIAWVAERLLDNGIGGQRAMLVEASQGR